MTSALVGLVLLGPANPDLQISEALRAALRDWQDEALNPGHPLAHRTEDEWEAAGRTLAEQLAVETGVPVDLEL